MPNTRTVRHQGNSNAIGISAPADLYSNSTVALDIETGKLKWYFQHLPGDDWDQDYTNERILLRTRVNPNPQAVKWIGADIPRNQQRDVSVSVGEGGGLFMLDRSSGKFLWAMPFPYDAPNFLIKKIDPDGTTWINDDVIVDRPGERHVICAYNTKSYWPMAYNPPRNSLYIQYVDNCLDMTAAVQAGQTAVENAPVEPQPNPVCAGLTPAEQQVALALNPPADATTAAGDGSAGAGRGRTEGRGGARGAAPAGGARGGGGATAAERRIAIRRAGSDPAKFSGIAKVNMETGQLTRFFETCAPTNGAVLTTAGDVVFFGDLAQRFRAMDADSGQGPLGNPASRQHSEQHHHICGEWPSVCRGHDGQRRRDQRPDHSSQHPATSAKHDGTVCVRAAELRRSGGTQYFTVLRHLLDDRHRCA